MSKEDKKEVIFPAIHALHALKSTAYNNSAYALSEVVDNSFEANAKNIHVAIICGEGEENPSTIAILDDGNGMDNDALRRSIQYGCGSHTGKDVSQIKGLGRFGVGLLSATFNQCQSLEVWSWQNGISSGNVAPKIELDFSSLDDEEESNFLPDTKNDSLPKFYNKVFANFPGIHDNLRNGTLVVWRKFHNLKWKKASTLKAHLAFECGRIYRNFIADGKIKIVLSIWGADFKLIDNFVVSVVDPMFLQPWDDHELLGKRCSLGHFKNRPMFIPFSGVPGDDRRDESGNVAPKEYPFEDNSGKYLGSYRILASYRSPEVLEVANALQGLDSDPGGMTFGQMARELEGVSVLRAGREIILDTKWLRADQTVDRWISVSIDFDPSLDEYFGVTNNKQSANHLSDLARYRQENDLADAAQNKVVFEAAKTIHYIMGEMRKKAREERRGARTKAKEGRTPEFRDPVSVGIPQLVELKRRVEKRAKDHPIQSDTGGHDDDPRGVIKGYEGTFFDLNPAEETRPVVVKEQGIKVDFVSEPNGGGAFFRVVPTAAVMIIKLNSDHPIYNRMADVMFPSDDEEEPDTALQAEKAILLIKYLLCCYARAECEAMGKKKDEFEAVRLEWGRVAKVILENEEDD